MSSDCRAPPAKARTASRTVTRSAPAGRAEGDRLDGGKGRSTPKGLPPGRTPRRRRRCRRGAHRPGRGAPRSRGTRPRRGGRGSRRPRRRAARAARRHGMRTGASCPAQANNLAGRGVEPAAHGSHVHAGVVLAHEAAVHLDEHLGGIAAARGHASKSAFALAMKSAAPTPLPDTSATRKNTRPPKAR